MKIRNVLAAGWWKETTIEETREGESSAEKKYLENEYELLNQLILSMKMVENTEDFNNYKDNIYNYIIYFFHSCFLPQAFDFIPGHFKYIDVRFKYAFPTFSKHFVYCKLLKKLRKLFT